MTPSNTELRTAITLALAEGCHFYHIKEQRAVEDRVLALFQAREQQLLAELLGAAKEYEKWVGGNQATGRAITVKAVPVSVIEKLQEKLNG